MLLDYENGIRGEIARAIGNYTKANHKYMYDYDEIKESSYIAYPDFNNQYGWALSEPLPYGGFANVEDKSMFTTEFIKNYDKNRDFDYTIVADVDYSEYLQPLHKDLPFLPEKSN